MCPNPQVNASSRQWVKNCFVATFNIVISYIFPESSSTLSEDMKIFSVNINYFHQFFGFFDISFVTKKLMTSAYNR